MQHQSKQSSRLGKHTRLAVALALALGVGTSSAMAAQTSATNRIQAADANVTQLTRGMSSGEAGRIAATAQPAPRAASNRTMATITVANCNDSGSGSLREAVGIAPSGTLVDMSGLSCTINLSSSIVTSADDLTLWADTTPSEKYEGPIPTVTIDGGDTVQPLQHTGSGTLSLHGLKVINGLDNGFARGGCIRSAGDVKLTDSSVKYCNATENDGSSAAGGGIYAAGSVTLDHAAVVGNTATNTGTGVANGGGIYAKSGITTNSYSIVRGNTAAATGSSNDAHGGGLYAVGGVSITDSIISLNSVESAGGDAHGGGAYASAYSVIKNSAISENHTDGDGGGLYLTDGARIKYSTVDNNTAGSVGGGIVAGNGSLTIESSTLDGNHAATTGGALFTRGNVSIDDSTISNNTADNVAGADLGRGATQPISITQSTISGNVSSDSKWGAGLYLTYDAVIKNSTITGNVEANAADTKYGAGISLNDNVSLELSSTIVAGNVIEHPDGTTDASDIFLASTSDGSTVTVTGDHTLIAFGMGSSLPGNIAADPELGPLQHNGGPTKTHVPLDGSPAVNAGAANGYSSDQRDEKRVRGAQADIGSVERILDRIFADGFDN